MEPSKPKSVAQRRVYGKRRANAPRAVLDGSPARKSTSKKMQHVDPVESIQAKLAEVTINDPPTLPEASESPKCEDEKQKETTESDSEALSLSSTVDSPDTKTIECSHEASPEASPEKPKGLQKMVEVRIYSKLAKMSPAPIVQSTEVKLELPVASESTESTSPPLAPTEPPSESPTTVQETTGEDEKFNVLERRRAARKKVPAPRRSSGVVHDDKASQYVRPILNEALSPLAAQSIQKFGSWASRSANMFDVAKLAEGSYGEVYKLHLREEACRPVVSKSKLAKLKSYGDGVFKVVPLRAKSGPGSKKFTSIDEIVAEVKMLKYLDPIPGFARFREIHVVQGRFPESFQNAWDHYKKTKEDCMNPNPSNKRAYPDTQLWAIIEMDDAGCELEKFTWSSIFQIYDIFWGVAMALARAEEYAMFEHRDLHLGNVCIRSTREDGCMDPPTEHDIARQSSSSGFGISALETTIIDYSLSRADLLLSDDPSGLTEIASSDLDKKQLFDAIGEDEDEIMQRNTYR
jgi:serine/threonine-protein kinase haspin